MLTEVLITSALMIAIDDEEAAAPRGPHEVQTDGGGVDIRFHPERSSAMSAPCSEVGHIQFLVMWANYSDRSIVVLPSQLRARDRWLDATASDAGLVVDTCRQSDPIYQDPELRGDSRTMTRMSDGPLLKDADIKPYHPQTNPSGWTSMTWRFQTYAYCNQGEARGTFYEGVGWTWEIDWQNVHAGSGQGTATFVADLPASAAARAPIRQALERYRAATSHPPVCGV